MAHGEKKTNKQVLLTGGAGFLGKEIVRLLLDKGYRITALVRSSSDYTALDRPGVSLVFGDVRDQDILRKAIKGAGFIIHAAAVMSGSWETYYDCNVQSTQDLLDLALEEKIEKFVYISSISVYDHSRLRSGAVLGEDRRLGSEEKMGFYPRTKLMAEKLVRKYIDEKDLPGVILRPGPIFGPGGPLFPARTGQGLGKSLILMVGNTRTEVPISYVENVAGAVGAALSVPELQGGSFNVLEERGVPRREYLRLVKRDIGAEVSSPWLPLWLVRLMQIGLRIMFGFMGKKAPFGSTNFTWFSRTFRYSSDKLRRYLPSYPTVDLETALHRTVEWHRIRRIPPRSEGIEKGRVILPEGGTFTAGIIGCGVISEVHLDALKRLGVIDKIFLADPDSERLELLKKKYPISGTYQDYKEMIEREKPDAVHVCVPPQLHREITAGALQAGCHVLVEKPMTLNGSEAESLIREAEKHYRRLCVMHNHLYDDVLIEARRLIAAGLIGRLTCLESWYGIQFKEKASQLNPKEHWKYAMPGSVFQDYLPHALYPILDSIGAAQVKYAARKYLGRTPGVQADELKVFLEGEGALGQVTVSLSNSPRRQFLKYYGTDGTLEVDLLNQTVFLESDSGPLPKSLGRSFTLLSRGKILRRAGRQNILNSLRGRFNIWAGSERLIHLFYRALLQGSEVPVPGSEGLELMRLMDQVWKKAE